MNKRDTAPEVDEKLLEWVKIALEASDDFEYEGLLCGNPKSKFMRSDVEVDDE